MVTGIEAAGLALAVLPLLVNQLDAYVRGIERLSRWRGYRREFAHYSTLFGAQHAILWQTLQEVLRDIVEDEEEVSELLRHPIDEGWNDPALREKLCIKLGQRYNPFVGIMTSLSSLLNRLSDMMGISVQDMRTGRPPEQKRMWKDFLRESIYKDLLGKIDEANMILKTLIEPPKHQEQARKRQHVRNYLLPRYKMARKDAEDLFKKIVEGTYWACDCEKDHCVHFQLQSNPLQFVKSRLAVSEFSEFRIIFSNMDDEDTTDSWGREIEFERWSTGQGPPPQLIQDLCSSLHVTETQNQTRQLIGVLPCETNQYAVHAIKGFQLPVPKKSLQQILSDLSRRERLRIATGLACSVIQLCGNWLKPQWNISDIYLEVSSNDSTLLDLFLFTWPLSTPDSQKERHSIFHPSTPRGNILVPLGRALVELSVGRSLGTSHLSAANDDDEVTKFDTATKLVETTLYESGSNYADAVHGCLFWTDRGSLCSEENTFQDRVFDMIISPLLRDLAHFEGLKF